MCEKRDLGGRFFYLLSLYLQHFYSNYKFNATFEHTGIVNNFRGCPLVPFMSGL